MQKREWKILDMFSGAGGMALGFAAAGGRCVGALEKDTAAANTFRKMFAHEEPVVLSGPVDGDAHHLSGERLAERLRELPDLIIGGPPCQGFSRVGRAKMRSLAQADLLSQERSQIDPHRNDLYRALLDTVRATAPMGFVIENVPGMREQDGVDRARAISSEASALGYNVRCFLLNAAWYGVPQHRWRLFIVGLRRDLGIRAVPAPPPRTHGDHARLPEGMAIPEDERIIWGEQIPRKPGTEGQGFVTVKEALHDLPRLRGHLEGKAPLEQALPYQREPSAWARMMRAWPGRAEVDLVTGNQYRFTPRDFPIFQEMAYGDRYPEALMIANRHFQEEIQRLQQKGEAPTPGTPCWEGVKARFIPPYRNDAFMDKWRKLIPDQPSWTVTAHLCRDTYSHIHYHNAQARTITVREAARLQSFPDSFHFTANMADSYRQIGNAVPPLLARALAEQLFTQIEALLEEEAARGSALSA